MRSKIFGTRRWRLRFMPGKRKTSKRNAARVKSGSGPSARPASCGAKRKKAGAGDLQKNPPDQAGKVSTNAERRAELGISKDQDERWQKLAAVPKEEFEAALAEPGVPTANSIIAKIAEKRSKPMDSAALWLWGRMKDFERNGILADDPDRVWAEMADHMRADMRRLVPRVCEWLNQLEASNAEQGNIGGREAARNSVRRV